MVPYGTCLRQTLRASIDSFHFNNREMRNAWDTPPPNRPALPLFDASILREEMPILKPPSISFSAPSVYIYIKGRPDLTLSARNGSRCGLAGGLPYSRLRTTQGS